MAGGPKLRPLFEALSGFLQIREQVLLNKALAKLWYDRFERFPHAKKFAAGLKEQVFVKQAVVEQGASLLPIPNHHADEIPLLGSKRRDAHRFVECFRAVVLLKPIACLAEPGFATQVVNLQV